MKTSCLLLALLSIHCLRPLALAQLVPDGGTAVVDGITNSLPGGLIVGTNGGNTTLIITNGGRVNSGNSTIGLNVGSSSNVVQVIGTGSAWSTTLTVGFHGSGNSLRVADGSSLFGNSLTLGLLGFASNNTAVITGPGSSALVERLQVGSAGNNNLLTISNGAAMWADFVSVGQAGSNNSIHITAGGWLSVSSDFRLKCLRSGGNQLLISNGGKLTNASGLIAASGEDVFDNDGSYGHVATVTGPGSIWHNRLGLAVGTFDQTRGGHKLIVSNSAEVLVDGRFLVGSNGIGNSVLVTGPGSRLINTRTSLLVDAIVGAGGTSNELVVADGGLVDVQRLAGRFLIGAANGADTGGTNSLVRVTGAGSLLKFTGNVIVGAASGGRAPHCRLVIENGGRVVANGVAMNSSQSARTEVTGVGSVLSLSVFAVNTSDSEMSISAGGRVISGRATIGSAGRLAVTDATLIVTNAAGTGSLDISGTNVFDGGEIIADQVLVDNGPNCDFRFRRGTLRSKNTAVANGRPFVVGNGVNAAVFELAGGTHTFSQGLVISPNATVRGCGTINGSVINRGTMIAECSGQPLTFAGAVTNYGSILNSGGSLQFNGPVASVILGISKAGSLAAVTCTTISGQNVLLQYKNLLEAPSWTDILPTLSASGHPITLNDPNSPSSNRFYRVRTD